MRRFLPFAPLAILALLIACAGGGTAPRPTTLEKAPPAAVEPEKPAPVSPPAPELARGDPGVKPAPKPEPKPASEPKAKPKPPPAPEPIIYQIANAPVTVGYLKLGLVRTKTDWVAFDRFGRFLVSKDKHFHVVLSIENTDTARRISYLGWGRYLKGLASLKDSVGNTYSQVGFGSSADVYLNNKGTDPFQIRSAVINPGRSVQDILLFQELIDRPGELTLILPMENVGGSGNLKVRVPTVYGAPR